MWPDDLDLAAELTAAGVRARETTAAAERPDPAFAGSLRERLVASAGTPAAPVRELPRRTVGVRDLLSSRRLAPLLAAALLLVAVGAAARTILVGTEPAPPSTPPSVPIVVGPAGGGLVVTMSPTPTLDASGSPSVSPSASPTAAATVEPTPPTPVPTPTPKATPVATAKPTPTAPTVGTMALTLSGCNGGVAIEWSAVSDARFHRYTTLRSSGSDIPAAYPPQAGSVEVLGTQIKDPAATSAVDPSAPTGVSLTYRTIALDAANQVIAASPVRSATAKPVASLGALSWASGEPGKTTFSWSAYGGPGACFTYYKLVYSETGPAPSYLEGSAAWAAVGDQGQASVVTGEPVPGTTYHVRLQVIHASASGKMLVAQTDVLSSWTAP